MNTNRLWVIGSVLAMAVILVLGWIVGVQPQLATAASATIQRVTVEQTNARYGAVLAKLKAEHDKLPELRQQLAALTSSVPADAQSAGFVKELNGVAAEKSVIIRSLTFSDAVAYKPPVAPAAPVASADSTATPSPSPSPTPAPAAPATPAAPPTMTNALITPTNFFASPVQVGVRGSLAQVLDFLEGAQKGQRLFLVTSLSSSPSTDEGVPPGTVDATIGGFIYSVTTASAAAQAAGDSALTGTTAEANASK